MEKNNVYFAAGNKNKTASVNFRLALDIEDCLDRFYGGYYSGLAFKDF